MIEAFSINIILARLGVYKQMFVHLGKEAMLAFNNHMF